MDQQQQGQSQQLETELLSMGFNPQLVKQALLLTQEREKAIELILSFDDKNESKPDLNKVTKPQDLSAEQLLGMSPTVIRNAGLKMEINVKNMQYPMGENVTEEFYKMVFLVRMDLKMGIGKIAAQTGHAVLGAYQQLEEELDNPETEKLLDNWEECGSAKIVLKVDSKDQLLELEKKAVGLGLNTYVVCDAGKTQVEPGSITVCAIGPSRSDLIDQVTGHLKLLN